MAKKIKKKFSDNFRNNTFKIGKWTFYLMVFKEGFENVSIYVS